MTDIFATVSPGPLENSLQQGRNNTVLVVNKAAAATSSSHVTMTYDWHYLPDGAESEYNILRNSGIDTTASNHLLMIGFPLTMRCSQGPQL